MTFLVEGVKKDVDLCVHLYKNYLSGSEFYSMVRVWEEGSMR